jgi:glycerol-3-phosphate acyltransferase PlsY
MLDHALWLGIGFLSGSIPWALVIGKFISHRDVREVGDGNPGSVNAWKSGGWVPGMLSMVVEVSKGLVPVYLAMNYLGAPSTLWAQLGLALVAFSPIVGHGWSPLLNFKGGKALAASWGSWIALTGGLAFPVALVSLGLIHGLQRNHSITVTSCLAGFLAVFLPLETELYLFLFWLANMALLIHKHRGEYSQGIVFRDWVLRVTLRQS